MSKRPDMTCRGVCWRFGTGADRSERATLQLRQQSRPLVELVDESVERWGSSPDLIPELRLPQLAQILRSLALLLDPGEVLEVVELLAVAIVELAIPVRQNALEVLRIVERRVQLGIRTILRAQFFDA